MKQFDNIISVAYYALSHDLSYRDYVDLMSAVRVKSFLIVQETLGSWYNYEYTNSLIHLKLFNTLGQEVFEINEMDWRLNSFEIWENPNWPPYQVTELYAQITDPRGNVLPHKNYGRGFYGLLKSIKVLRELAKFECIAHYELAKRNKDLKDKIEMISKDIIDLKKSSSKT